MRNGTSFTISIAAAGALLCGAAGAQQRDPGGLAVFRGKLRDAGTFHLATRTWTRGGQPAAEARRP